MDGLNGLQDLLPEPQGGAHGEGSPGLTPPQVGQVTTLQWVEGGDTQLTSQREALEALEACKHLHFPPFLNKVSS